jgi:hypothetical protein
MGPLDRWLQRTTEPERQPSASSSSDDGEEPRGDQNTAPPPAHSNRKQRAPAGPLSAFLVKSSAGHASQRTDATLEALHKGLRRSG